MFAITSNILCMTCDEHNFLVKELGPDEWQQEISSSFFQKGWGILFVSLP